ncbi:tRNA 2-thiouridine(34) synthase MnmA [Candidatus Dojkabacteria bacterium]|nr:tRNA 2-thiouridine(34) synthase MnmA [Candidatus Dojkabacteria bacterium]
MTKKIFVALSGGVDSSVAALKLKEQGYELTGVHMQTGYTTEEDRSSVVAIGELLEIPIKFYDVRKEFDEDVLNYFIKEYTAGRTPNPCVVCNKKIKFGKLLDLCFKDGADYIATGHYVQKGDDDLLLRGKDKRKDQSYFLYSISSPVLSKCFFPLGNYLKDEVRTIALKSGLPTSSRKESQDICFMKNENYITLLGSYIKNMKGDIIDIDSGDKVGEHNGYWRYTIGQRKGLRVGGAAKPYFVAKIHPKDNVVYVCMGKEHDELYSRKIYVEKLNLINPKYEMSDNLSASIRYNHNPQPGELIIKQENKIYFEFEEPQRAVTLGQSLVVYDGRVCIGGGIIRDSQ